MINKILNKVTLGKVKIKDDGNDNQEDWWGYIWRICK
jgi:hypothetical protein